MSKAGKAAEPSMEEILSSIRKIIAEEPASVRPAAGPQSPGTASGLLPGAEAAPAAPVVNGTASAPTNSKSSIDDILDLADGAPRVEAPAAASAEGARNGSSIPSWLFPTPRADGGTEAKTEGAAAAALKAPVETPRDAPRPFFPSTNSTPVANGAPLPAPQPQAPGGRGAVNGAPAKILDEPGRGDDLGSVVPRRAPEAAPAASVLERRTPQAGLPEWLSRSVAVPAKPGAAEPVAAPVEPTRLAAREPEVPTPALSELAKPAANLPAGPQASQRPQSPAVKAEAAADASVNAATGGSGEAAETVKVEAPASAVPPAAEVAAVVVPPVAAEPAVDANKGTAPADSSAPVADKSGQSVVITEGPAFTTVPKPTLLNERGRTPKVGVPGDMVPTIAQSTAVRTLDDTIIDLLRPMIRQWLDDNMPRMVEKALRVELAASVKPKSDQPKH